MLSTKPEKILKNLGINNTKIRRLILESLLSDAHFLSLNDISIYIEKKEGKSINLKSLYNNLKMLTNVGALDTRVDDHKVYYAIHDGLVSSKQHVHVINNRKNTITHSYISDKTTKLIYKELEEQGIKVDQIVISAYKNSK